MAIGIGNAVGRVRAAAARTSNARTARLAFGIGAKSPVPEERDRLGDGVVDFAARRAHVSQQMFPVSIGERIADVPAEEGAPDVRALIARRHEIVHVGGATYWRSGESWVGEFGDPEGPRGHSDPMWPLDALFGAGEDVVEVGAEVVRDVDTTRYRLTVDLPAADGFVPAGISMPAGPLRRMREVPAEIWLDADGLARRIAIMMSGFSGSGTQQQTWMFVEFWDFGVDVAIDAPNPEHVTVLSDADWPKFLMGDL